MDWRRSVVGGCLVLGMAAWRAGAAEPGLVAHYPLDEGEGEVARDASGRANPGVIRGATWEKQGAQSFLRFDGADDRVECGSASALDLREAVTLSAWVLPETTPDGEVGICGKHFDSYLLSYYRDVHAYWYIGSGGNNSKAVLASGVWTHLAGTFDGSVLRLYQNGELVHERTSRIQGIPAGRGFYIGCVVGDPAAADPNYTQSGFFSGCISDVRVYSRALSATELQAQCAADGRSRFALATTEVASARLIRRVSAAGIRVGAAADGTIQVDNRGTFFLLASSFSTPGERIGWNTLGPRAAVTGPDWQPQVRRAKGKALSLWAAGRAYTLERTVAIDGSRLRITDTLTNLTDAPLGVLIRHRLHLAQGTSRSRLGVRASDPILFAATPALDLGVLAEDDVSRSQFSPLCRGNTLGFNLSHIGLAAGTTRTLSWVVYLLAPTGDPLAFINTVRGDYGANHTIPGPCSFFDATSDLIDDPVRLKDYLTRRRLGVAMLSPWLDYDPGQMSYTMVRPEYKAMMQKACAALKQAVPEIQVIGCIETDWVGLDPTRLAGGEKLPRPGGAATGAAFLDRDAAQVIYDAKLPWLDSLKLDRQGRPVLELYTRGGKPQWALGVYPAPGNYQAGFLLDQARFLCEEVGLDGWYIDEFSLYWVRSYDKWDGCTVDIDPNSGRILTRYTDANLAGVAPRLALCDYAVKNHRLMICNTYATTFAESRLPVLRFAETWSSFDPEALPRTGKPPYFAELASSQLGTMIGLGANGLNLKTPTAELLMRSLSTYLRHSMVYYHYFYGDLPLTGEGSGEYGPINHMFPLTPVRLFEGGIEGQERTITTVSGVHTWPHATPPVVRVFGPDGRPVPTQPRLTRGRKGWTVELALDEWRQIAVIAGE